MATLSASDRDLATAELERTWSRERHRCGLSARSDLRAAIDAADDWVNSNAASFNTALPVAARTSLSAADKARLLVFVVERRYLSGA